MTLQPLAADDNAVARWAAVLVPARQLAEVIAGTEFVPRDMRGKPDVVTAAIMYGDELGVGPMQALAGIHVVEGRPQPSAELMRALILRDGHTITVHDLTGSRCRVSGLRRGAPESERAVVEWTLDMARAAGLLNRQNWRTYPRAMLLARATGDLARMMFADVVKGLGYVAEDEPADPAAWGLAAEPVAPEPAEPIQRRERHTPRPLDGPPVAPPIPTGPTHRPPAMAPAAGTDDVPLPEPPPDAEPPPPDGPPAPQPIGVRPLRALHAKLGEALGSVATRSERLALCAAIIGHPLDSTNDLTREEGYEVLRVLDRLVTGEAYFTIADDGSMEVTEQGQEGTP